MKKAVIFFLFALAVCSCGSYKRLALLQDMDASTTYDVTTRPDPRIAKGDKLKILVTSSQPILAAPFNVVSASQNYNSVTEETFYEATGSQEMGYLVDKKGCINFPVLGKIYVEGMTLEDLEQIIETQIMDHNYIKDPIVTCEFINFQITIMGETGSIGNYIIRSGGINLLEALAMCGGVNDTGLMDNLWVIRTTGDTRKVYTINLKSRSLYDSPAFWLQQNDMIYVAPKDNKFDTHTNDMLTVLTTILSTLSSIAYILLWTSTYAK